MMIPFLEIGPSISLNITFAVRGSLEVFLIRPSYFFSEAN
jgi:hypothetical protein